MNAASLPPRRNRTAKPEVDAPLTELLVYRRDVRLTAHHNNLLILILILPLLWLGASALMRLLPLLPRPAEISR